MTKSAAMPPQASILTIRPITIQPAMISPTATTSRNMTGSGVKQRVEVGRVEQLDQDQQGRRYQGDDPARPARLRGERAQLAVQLSPLAHGLGDAVEDLGHVSAGLAMQLGDERDLLHVACVHADRDRAKRILERHPELLVGYHALELSPGWFARALRHQRDARDHAVSRAHRGGELLQVRGKLIGEQDALTSHAAVDDGSRHQWDEDQRDHADDRGPRERGQQDGAARASTRRSGRRLSIAGRSIRAISSFSLNSSHQRSRSSERSARASRLVTGSAAVSASGRGRRGDELRRPARARCRGRSAARGGARRSRRRPARRPRRRAPARAWRTRTAACAGRGERRAHREVPLVPACGGCAAGVGVIAPGSFTLRLANFSRNSGLSPLPFSEPTAVWPFPTASTS